MVMVTEEYPKSPEMLLPQDFLSHHPLQHSFSDKPKTGPGPLCGTYHRASGWATQVTTAAKPEGLARGLRAAEAVHTGIPTAQMGKLRLREGRDDSPVALHLS